MTPWVKRIEGAHVCHQPINDDQDPFETGSLWQCPDCSKLWEFRPYWLDAQRWTEPRA